MRQVDVGEVDDHSAGVEVVRFAQRTHNPKVVGSIRTRPIRKALHLKDFRAAEKLSVSVCESLFSSEFLPKAPHGPRSWLHAPAGGEGLCRAASRPANTQSASCGTRRALDGLD
jgi:hypothetical protein